jgi:glycolate oxidase FAD binding subunit
MLGFDPFDHGPIFGGQVGKATIGGIVAAGVAGSQRLSGLAARDHLLGFRAVSGRGELFVAGGKVVKNVTGFDLPKLAAGSWGRLFALTELTLKVLPRPREAVTRILRGLSESEAVAAMSRAMGSQAEIAAAAHLPGGEPRESMTIFRIQGFGPSVAARCAMLEVLLADFGLLEAAEGEDADALWEKLRTLSPLGESGTIWRIVVPPSRALEAVAAIHDEARLLFDWAGGLVWAASEADPVLIRDAARRLGGHAMLVRAEPSKRAAIPAFHPPEEGLALLEEKVRRAFDPEGVFETGRF